MTEPNDDGNGAAPGITRRTVIKGTAAGVGAVGLGTVPSVGAAQQADGDPMGFRVRIENVSTPDTLDTSEGPRPVPLSPGAYAVHDPSVSLFGVGEAASAGLEDVAEDGMPPELAAADGVSESGAFAGPQTVADPNQPEGGPEPPIFPGGAYEFVVRAVPGDRLSFATMFIQSNDLFYAPAPEGIPLFENDSPVEGDVTDQVALWDAGTEIDQEPGVGTDQAPRQSGLDTGAADDDSSTVQPIEAVNSEGYDYPATGEVVEVTVEAGVDFTLAKYTTPRGRVTADGFQVAVREWARGDIDTDQLRQALSLFVTGGTAD